MLLNDKPMNNTCFVSVEVLCAEHEFTADTHATGLRPALAKHAGTCSQYLQQSLCRTVARHAMKSRLQHALLTIILKLCSLKRVPPNKKQQPVSNTVFYHSAQDML